MKCFGTVMREIAFGLPTPMIRFCKLRFEVGSYLIRRANCLSQVSMACLLIAAGFGTVASVETDPHFAGEEPLLIKAVVVTMFEHGAPTGDRPGEMQLWVERYPFSQMLPFEGGVRPLWYSADGVLLICTGGGIANATASILALGVDARFDLSEAYWVIAGIAGGDPLDVSLGSAVWARQVVDGDLAYEIDAREIPDDWPYGLLPLGATRPVRPGEPIGDGWSVDTVSFQLNEVLVTRIYEATKDIRLPVSESAEKLGALYKGYPRAQEIPRVRLGETLAASTYWHGEKLNEWANDWVVVQSDASKNFMTSNMEDSGTLTAIRRLDQMRRADFDRVLVLRTVSNFTMPPPGKSAAWSATSPYPDAGMQAIEAAYIVGSAAVKTLLQDWADKEADRSR